MKTQTLTIIDVAEFTWMWGPSFFLETNKGNFIWDSPDYGGDNTIRPFKGTLQSYLELNDISFGRSKGSSIICLKCGDNVKIETQKEDICLRCGKKMSGQAIAMGAPFCSKDCVEDSKI